MINCRDSSDHKYRYDPYDAHATKGSSEFGAVELIEHFVVSVFHISALKTAPKSYNFSSVTFPFKICVNLLHKDFFRDRVCHVGFCGGQSGAEVGFLRVLRFLLPIFIPAIASKIILIYDRGLYNRPNWPQYQGLIDT
jgi:hypothetical protein